QLLAVQLVAAVHRLRMRELVLADAAGALLSLEIGQAEGGDRGGVNKGDGTAVRFAFVLRELEQVQRPFDVDVMRGDRRELRTRREERREMKNALDFELGEDALEQIQVGDRPGKLACD